MEKEITYQIEELLNNTYRIDEGGAANCYLVIGEENALLIDSCWGSGNLKECVAQLTEKPVIVTMTHRHPDHTFGARQFGDYYVSKKDNILFNRVLDSQLMGRLSQKTTTKLWVKRSKPLPLEEGQISTLEIGILRWYPFPDILQVLSCILTMPINSCSPVII